MHFDMAREAGFLGLAAGLTVGIMSGQGSGKRTSRRAAACLAGEQQRR